MKEKACMSYAPTPASRQMITFCKKKKKKKRNRLLLAQTVRITGYKRYYTKSLRVLIFAIQKKYLPQYFPPRSLFCSDDEEYQYEKEEQQ